MQLELNMIKNQLKVLWFKAEDKAVEFSKSDIFGVISKLFYTSVLFMICLIAFIIFAIHVIWMVAKEKYVSKFQRNNDTKDLDEYSANDEYVLPDKVEPSDLDQVERIRKWM